MAEEKIKVGLREIDGGFMKHGNLGENMSVINRASLVDYFGIKFKTEKPEKREKRIRFGVDKGLVKLFGAKHFLGYDWNIRKPVYTIEEISDILEKANLDIPVGIFVRQEFCVLSNYFTDYYFEELVNPQGRKLYKLTHRIKYKG